MFNWHLFRHEMFCYLFPHGRSSIGIFSGMRSFVICFLMAEVRLAYFPARDVLLFVSSWPMFNWHIFRHEMFYYLFPHGRCLIGIFSGMRSFVICFLMADV